MSMIKSVAKFLAAQTVVGLAVSAIEKNVIEPAKEKVKEVWNNRKENQNSKSS